MKGSWQTLLFLPGHFFLPGRTSNFPTLTFYHAFVKLSRVKFLYIILQRAKVMKCQIFDGVKFRGSSPLASSCGGCQILKRAANELRLSNFKTSCKLSCKLSQLSNFMWMSCKLSCKNLTQLQISGIIYIYISPFIITQICGSCNFMKLSNFLPPAF